MIDINSPSTYKQYPAKIFFFLEEVRKTYVAISFDDIQYFYFVYKFWVTVCNSCVVITG